MPRFGAHSFIWVSEWTKEGAERVVPAAAEAGLDFIEISLLRPESIDIASTVKLLEQYSVTALCSVALPKGAHMPVAPEKADEFLRNAVDVASGLGSPILTGAPHANLGTLTGKPPTEQELTTISETLKSVAQYAAERDMSLGIEVINRYETYLINAAHQAADMLERIDEPNTFVHLDTYHMNIEEKGFYDPIIALGSKLQYVHLSESDRTVPGTGNVHWDEVSRALSDVDFDGWLAMESFVDINEDLMAATALWRPAVEDSDTLVRDGLKFLRTKGTEYQLLK